MNFTGNQPWSEEEIRHRLLELQRQVERCRKQLEVAESEVALLSDKLAEPDIARTRPILAGRLAGL